MGAPRRVIDARRTEPAIITDLGSAPLEVLDRAEAELTRVALGQPARIPVGAVRPRSRRATVRAVARGGAVGVTAFGAVFAGGAALGAHRVGLALAGKALLLLAAVVVALPLASKAASRLLALILRPFTGGHHCPGCPDH